MMSLNSCNLLLHKNRNISYFHLYTATATFQMPMDIFRNDNIKISQIAKNVKTRWTSIACPALTYGI